MLENVFYNKSGYFSHLFKYTFTAIFHYSSDMYTAYGMLDHLKNTGLFINSWACTIKLFEKENAVLHFYFILHGVETEINVAITRVYCRVDIPSMWCLKSHSSVLGIYLPFSASTECSKIDIKDSWQSLYRLFIGNIKIYVQSSSKYQIHSLSMYIRVSNEKWKLISFYDFRVSFLNRFHRQS